jgi:hypothetical protein
MVNSMTRFLSPTDDLSCLEHISFRVQLQISLAYSIILVIPICAERSIHMRGVQTKRFLSKVLNLAIVLMELYLAYRASFIGFLFFDHIDRQALFSAMPKAQPLLPSLPATTDPNAWSMAAFLFIAVFSAGYVVSSYPSVVRRVLVLRVFHTGIRIPGLVLAVLLMDWGGIFYLASYNGFTLDIITASITISMCLIATVPIGLGTAKEAIRAEIPAELQEERNNRVTAFEHYMEQRAMQAFLRIVGNDPHTLIRFLPPELQQQEYTTIMLDELERRKREKEQYWFRLGFLHLQKHAVRAVEAYSSSSSVLPAPSSSVPPALPTPGKEPVTSARLPSKRRSQPSLAQAQDPPRTESSPPVSGGVATADLTPVAPHAHPSSAPAPALPIEKVPVDLVSGGAGGGRIPGHTNAFCWYILLYRARHDTYPDGVSAAMKSYWEHHPKLQEAFRVVKLEKKGVQVDYARYYRNFHSPARGTAGQKRRPASAARGRIVDISARSHAHQRLV